MEDLVKCYLLVHVTPWNFIFFDHLIRFDICSDMVYTKVNCKMQQYIGWVSNKIIPFAMINCLFKYDLHILDIFGRGLMDRKEEKQVSLKSPLVWEFVMRGKIEELSMWASLSRARNL